MRQAAGSSRPAYCLGYVAVGKSLTMTLRSSLWTFRPPSPPSYSMKPQFCILPDSICARRQIRLKISRAALEAQGSRTYRQWQLECTAGVPTEEEHRQTASHAELSGAHRVAPPVAAGGPNNEAVPDSILKGEPAPAVKNGFNGIERAADAQQNQGLQVEGGELGLTAIS
jgi:hypothetical protein